MLETPIEDIVPPTVPCALVVLRDSPDQNGTPELVPVRTEAGATLAKAPLLRRVVADAVDRLVPLPFIAAFFPPWIVVIVLYELLCDSQGGSVGKRLLGLRTVVVSHDPSWQGRDCTVLRSCLRNLSVCLMRLCYLSMAFAPVGFALDLVEILFVLFRKDGRRPGDLLAGTQVIAKESEVRA